MILDTGSSTIWVPSTSYPATDCHGMFRHNSTASTAYLANSTAFSIAYGFSSVSGTVATDTLRLSALTLPAQDFGEATSGVEIAEWCHNGVLGLGFDGHAAVNEMAPPFHHLFNQELLAAPVFAFFFNDLRDPESGESELTLGDMSPDHYARSLVEFPLRRKQTWEVVIDGIAFGNESLLLVDAGGEYRCRRVADRSASGLRGQAVGPLSLRFSCLSELMIQPGTPIWALGKAQTISGRFLARLW